MKTISLVFIALLVAVPIVSAQDFAWEDLTEDQKYMFVIGATTSLVALREVGDMFSSEVEPRDMIEHVIESWLDNSPADLYDYMNLVSRRVVELDDILSQLSAALLSGINDTVPSTAAPERRR